MAKFTFADAILRSIQHQDSVRAENERRAEQSRQFDESIARQDEQIDIQRRGVAVEESKLTIEERVRYAQLRQGERALDQEDKKIGISSDAQKANEKYQGAQIQEHAKDRAQRATEFEVGNPYTTAAGANAFVKSAGITGKDGQPIDFTQYADKSGRVLNTHVLQVIALMNDTAKTQQMAEAMGFKYGKEDIERITDFTNAAWGSAETILDPGEFKKLGGLTSGETLAGIMAPTPQSANKSLGVRASVKEAENMITGQNNQAAISNFIDKNVEPFLAMKSKMYSSKGKLFSEAGTTAIQLHTALTNALNPMQDRDSNETIYDPADYGLDAESLTPAVKTKIRTALKKIESITNAYYEQIGVMKEGAKQMQMLNRQTSLEETKAGLKE